MMIWCPINFMLGDVWGNGQAAPTYSVVLWAYYEMTEEEKSEHIRQVDLNNNGMEYPIIDETIIEQKALAAFGISAEELRSGEDYDEEHKGYLYMGFGLGVQPAYVIDAVEEEGDQLVIIYREISTPNYPDELEPPDAQIKTFRLTIELQGGRAPAV